MCDYCHQTPCNARCPNAEPHIVFYCERCENPIYPGERYAAVCDAIICEDCLSDMTSAEWMNLAGGEKRTAKG